LRARYYAPEQGRFTTRDPFPGVASSPASLHPYLYVLNNPLIYTDPDGEFGLLAAIAIGALAGAAIGGLWNYGTQIYENMTQCGMGFWDAAALRNIDGSRLGMAMLEGGLFGAVGALTGGLLAMAEIGGLAAFAYSGFVDIGLGFAWDTTVHGYTPSEAFFSNILSFGAGEVIGLGVRTAARVFVGEIKPFRELPRLVGYDRHHLIEQRLAPVLGVRPGDIPAAYIEPGIHREFTDAWMRAIGYDTHLTDVRTSTATYDDIWHAARDIYADHPEMWNAVSDFFESLDLP
jgi:hypothetical protein